MSLTSLARVPDAYQMQSLTQAIRPTTLIRPQKLRDKLGLDLTIASEAFQHTGSFKFRAAYNVALNVANDHLYTASSGNFGQALAYAAKLTGKKCTVVMPDRSAKVKIAAVGNYGATVDLIDTTRVGRSQRITQLADEIPDGYFASPYDDDYVIAGNSSLADELTPEEFDVIVAPVGGGGLISGIATGISRNNRSTALIGAEPLLGNDAARSLREGRLISNESEPPTLADGARTLSLGERNWPIIKDNVREIIEVSEEKIAAAVKMLYDLANLKCEPTSGLSLGAILEDPAKFADKKICVVVTGGNVDAEVYKCLIS